MCNIVKCTVCHQVWRHDYLHVPPCARLHEVYQQCTACKERLGDLGIDRNQPFTTSAGRAAPAEKPLPAPAEESRNIPGGGQRKRGQRRAANLLRAMAAGQIRRKLTEVKKVKDWERAKAKAAEEAAVLGNQQQQQQPPPPSLENFTFGPEDFVLEDPEENSALQRYIQDNPEELMHYLKIIRHDDPELLQLCLQMVESRVKRGQATSKPVNHKQPEEEDISLPIDLALDVADDDRDEFLSPDYADIGQITALLPATSKDLAFDYSQPAPAPDTSGLVTLVGDDDPGVQGYLEAVGDSHNGMPPAPGTDFSQPAPPAPNMSGLIGLDDDDDDDLELFIRVSDKYDEQHDAKMGGA